MRNIEKILNTLKVKFYKKSNKNNNRITYYCIIDFSENEDGLEEDELKKFSFIIVEELANKFIGIYGTSIMRVKQKDEIKVLKIINKENLENVYGTLYINEENEIEYYIGISTDSDEENIKTEQIHDYLSNMMIYSDSMIKKLIENNLTDDKSDTNEG
ncbi:hypothetical protein LL033_17275 [Clostridium estertheticum]|uniref:hypothetical protein n=1 Tax=Clostridium estertheticum TaxID=238834 RepID=UPI001C0BF648|nr:hypothetical protein [Clostridium estertheticum]MBU3216679.1 hypothetical protein [Clostridium estertheticum]WAG54365.1 hypothetical protein LL033_17275 [Clostridium estertheticum]